MVTGEKIKRSKGIVGKQIKVAYEEQLQKQEGKKVQRSFFFRKSIKWLPKLPTFYNLASQSFN